MHCSWPTLWNIKEAEYSSAQHCIANSLLQLHQGYPSHLIKCWKLKKNVYTLYRIIIYIETCICLCNIDIFYSPSLVIRYTESFKWMLAAFLLPIMENRRSAERAGELVAGQSSEAHRVLCLQSEAAHQVIIIALYLNSGSSPLRLLQSNKGLIGFMYNCLFLLKTSVIFCRPNVPIINVNGEKY